MIDVVKKMVFSGIGAIALTKDKLEELADEIAKAGQMSKEEGEKLAEEFKKKSDEAQKQVEAKIQAAVDKAVERLHLVKKSDLEVLQQRITKLETKIASLSIPN